MEQIEYDKNGMLMPQKVNYVQNKSQEKSIELKKELEKLRKFLNYKKSNFCKKILDEIIKNYFTEDLKRR